MIAMATHKMTVMILLERGALPEHSKVKEEKLPALPSDDTSWTYMKLKWTNTCTYAYICIDYTDMHTCIQIPCKHREVQCHAQIIYTHCDNLVQSITWGLGTGVHTQT